MTNEVVLAAYLDHHGIKGMHWGVRKRRDEGSDVGSQPKPDHTKRNRRIKIAAGTAVAVGAVATAILLRRHSNIQVKNLRSQHEGFVQAEHILKGKLKTRMSDLKDLSKMTEKGHPSHEGALKEIANLHSFYQARLNKMAQKNGVDPQTLKKLKLGGLKG